MSEFHKMWLNVWCAAVFVFGLVLAGGGMAATDGISTPVMMLLGSMDSWTNTRELQFSVAILGAVTLAWGATFYVLFGVLHALDRAAAAPHWRKLIIAMLVWFVIDNIMSYATGFWLNIVSNSAFFGLMLIPIFRSGVLKGDKS